MLGARINRVLVEPLSWHSSAANESDEFCGNVAEFMSLAFEDQQFQLPTFHSAKVLAEETWEQGVRVCFEELTVLPRASSFGNVRHVSEAANLRRLSFARCNMPSTRFNLLEDDWQAELHERPKVLMLEHSENRYILNSSELCLGLRPACESWLLQQPEERGFCPYARAGHWADIIVMRTGAHVEYASIAGRRGTVLIVIYAYPLLLQRIDAPAPPQRGLAPSPHRLRQGTPAHLSRRPSPPHAALPLIHPHTYAHTHTHARTHTHTL